MPSDSPFINQFFNLLHGGKPAPGPLPEFVVRRCWETDQAVMADRLRALESFDASDRLWRIDAPTLIVAGTRDVAVPADRQQALAAEDRPGRGSRRSRGPVTSASSAIAARSPAGSPGTWSGPVARSPDGGGPSVSVPDRPLVTTAMERALRWAADHHRDQRRKGSDLPYVQHPMAVALILERAGWPEPVVIAGLLHDLVEDTDVTLDRVRDTFGDGIAALVDACSEVKLDARGASASLGGPQAGARRVPGRVPGRGPRRRPGRQAAQPGEHRV